MVTINPADCKPDEVYEGTVDGDLCVLVRNDPGDARPWSGLHRDGNSEFYLSDDDVPALVRLVPAREVTRDDLPSHGEVISLWLTEESRGESADAVLDAVVARLNANGGLPTDDRWRRAHAIVEQERDQARREREYQRNYVRKSRRIRTSAPGADQ